jgi:hypothetical protein
MSLGTTLADIIVRLRQGRFTATLEEQFAESARLESAIRQNFARLGFMQPPKK